MDEPVPLLEALGAHQPAGPEEAASLERMIAFARDKVAPFDRTDPEGHFTGSGLVAAPELDRVILLHHRKLDMWLQCGGHARPGETRGRTIAVREAREETGLPDLRPHPSWPGLLDVDVHEIPPSGQMPAHEHLDLRYLLVADPSREPRPPEEEAFEVRWFTWEEVEGMDLDEGLERLLWKVRSIRVTEGLDDRSRTVHLG